MPRRRVVGLLIVALSLVAALPAGADDDPIEPPPAPPPRSFTIGATGDTITEMAVRRMASTNGAKLRPRRRYDFVPQFAAMKPLLEQLDLAICHVEMPIGTRKQTPGLVKIKRLGTRRLLTPYELAPALAATGFDRCTTASNHSYDLGDPGVNSTLDALDAVGISHHGTARAPDEVAAGLLDINGVRVAHMSYSRTSRSRFQRDDWRVNDGHDIARIGSDVVAARAAGAEVVVLSIHIGSAGSTVPERHIAEYLQNLTSWADVDLIIMHGPHVVQPVVQYNGTWVFQSLGNFVTGQGPGHSTKILRSLFMLDGLLGVARFTEDPARPGRFTVAVTPVAICTIRKGRYVYPATATLARDDISESLRKDLTVVLARIRQVVPEAA